MVGADEVKQSGAGKTAGVIADRVDGIGNSAAFDFLVVNFATGPARQGQPQQAQSLFRRRKHQSRLERRLCGGNEKQAGELEFLLCRPSHEQVAEVDWIERPAE